MMEPEHQERPGHWASAWVWMHADEDRKVLEVIITGTQDLESRVKLDHTVALGRTETNKLRKAVETGLLDLFAEGWAWVVEPF